MWADWLAAVPWQMVAGNTIFSFSIFFCHEFTKPKQLPKLWWHSIDWDSFILRFTDQVTLIWEGFHLLLKMWRTVLRFAHNTFTYSNFFHCKEVKLPVPAPGVCFAFLLCLYLPLKTKGGILFPRTGMHDCHIWGHFSLRHQWTLAQWFGNQLNECAM